MTFRRFARCALVIVVLGAVAILTAPRASAGDISRRCSFLECDPQIVFRARPGEVNSLIQWTPIRDRVFIADATSRFTLTSIGFPSGNGCRFEDRRELDRLSFPHFPPLHVVSCPWEFGGRDRVVLYLGDRDDRVEADMSGRFEIHGGPGDDEIDTPGNNRGNSILYGEEGNDHLRGGSGADLLFGGLGRDVLDGGWGPDELSGGLGEDVADYDNWNPTHGHVRAAVRVSIGAGAGDDGSFQDGGAGHRDTVRGDIEDVRGTDGDDVLIGDSGENTLIGLDGDDQLLGLGGPDTLLGGGFTNFVARTGTRFYWGGSNRLEGGAGDDTLIGGFQGDFLQGGEGNDVLRGDDAAVRKEGTDVLHGGPGRDLLDGGRFTRDPSTGRVSKDRIYGDAGVDTVTYEVRTGELVVHLDNSANDGEQGERDNIHNDVERVLGGAGDDRLVGSRFDNALVGNSGSDILDGALGHDDLVGGPGRDTVMYATRTQPVNVALDDAFNDGERNEQDNVRRSVEEVFGGRGDDLIVGNEFANVLHGGPGHDELRGGGGPDLLAGDEGPDLLFAADGGADSVQGGPDIDCAQVDAGLDVVEFVEAMFPCAAPPPPSPPPLPTPTPSSPSPSPQCSDGGDNDSDGRVDLNDPGCENAADDSESPDPDLPACSDGKDNDNDGKIDAKDPGCDGSNDDSESPDPKPDNNTQQCSDGKDNDGDGNVDYPNDKDCSSKDDDSEGK